ncbi:LamG domain-containing protein [Kitasatospora sp. NPDC049285]|uniref:LamG domain-containing protein n=1 Tax=Kitasatospora sp. NPDC049285 TaxID=3157096 RepID=UPI0034183347
MGPDAAYWEAMAEAEQREARRKRMLGLTLGGGALVAVGAMITVAVVVSQHSDGTPAAKPARSAAAPSAAAPSGTAAAKPADKAESAAKPEGLQPGSAAKLGPADGRDGTALLLPGNGDGYAEAADAGIDTAKDFTVSAVVRNDAASDPKAALSQNGEQFFAYYLGREDSSAATRNRWVFKVQTANEAGKTAMALSTAPAATGRWTTLTGVYNAKAKTISLYVDGTLAQTTPAPAVLPAKGPLELGRARYKAHWADAWNGGITDVRLWRQALTADQVTRLTKTRTPDPAPAAVLLQP